MKSKKKALTPEEKLSQALLPREEWPYELPKGWVWTRIDNINEFQNKSYMPNKEPERNFEVYSVPSYAKGFPDALKGIEIGSSKQLVQKGDILLCKINPRINRVWKVYGFTENLLLASSEWIVVRNNNIMPDYLLWYFRSSMFREYMLSNVSGVGGSLMRAQPKFVKSYPVPLPPLPEQQRIVDKIESLFAKLDEAGDRLQKVLDGYEARRAAILHEAFSGKWTGDHGAGDMSVPKGWRKVKLSDVCTINPKKLDTSSLEDSLEVSFIPMASVDEVLGEVTKPEVRNLGKVKKGFTNFQEGDVVFAKITPCMENGKSAVIGPLLNDIGYGTTEFYVLRCHPELYNRFLYHLVRSIKFRSDAKSQMTGAVGQQRVPKNFMADYEILLPPLDEQIQIVQMVDTFFKKEYEVRKMSQNVIDQIDLMKKSILARAFRGELGTQNPSDPSALELLKECVLAGKEVSKS